METSLEQALERIEAALSRAEGASRAIVQAKGDVSERHDRLKTAVERSLSQIDELIAQHRP